MDSAGGHVDELRGMEEYDKIQPRKGKTYYIIKIKKIKKS